MGVTPARIGSAAAVSGAPEEGSLRRGADRVASEAKITRSDLGDHLGPEGPGELVRMAAATTERTFLWAASWRKRRDRRTCAAHERATVWGAHLLGAL